MNRFRRDVSASRSRVISDDDIRARQALIDVNEELICDSGNITTNHNAYRLQRLKTTPGYHNAHTTIETSSESNTESTLYDIQPGDSLLGICLRYSCPVNQVKRLNGLMTDQEFYGLKKLKLPLGRLGLLEDLLRQQSNHIQALQHHPATNCQKLIDYTSSPGSALSIAGGDVTVDNGSKQEPGIIDNINQTALIAKRDESNHSFYSADVRYKDLEEHAFNLHDTSKDRQALQESINSTRNIFPQSCVELTEGAFIRTNNVTTTTTTTNDTNQIFTSDTTSDSSNGNVFKDLDYHVTQAKVAARRYSQRAAELANFIDINNQTAIDTSVRFTGSSGFADVYPSSENFGFNARNFIIVATIFCVIITFVFLNRISQINSELDSTS